MFNLFGRTHATKMTGAIGRCGNDSFALKLDNRELKHATFLSHGRQPEVNNSHARAVVFPRFSN